MPGLGPRGVRDYPGMNGITRKPLAMLVAAALIALPGCATDDAVKKDAKNAEPGVKKAAKDVKKTGSKAVDAVDDNDSK